MITRPDLIGLLSDSLKDVDLRMGTTVADISQTADKADVRFSPGGREAFDLVVGCDGIHSRTRQQVFGAASLRSTGWGGWAWWADPSLSPQNVITEYWTPGRFLGLYPARDQLFCFLGMPNAALGPDPEHPRVDVVREPLRHLAGAAAGVLASPVSAQGLFHWDFSDLSMTCWHRGRVLLIGDACDAILPTAGIGASSAMESAAVLADELARSGADDVPRTCERYRRRRQRRVHAFQESSRQMAALMFLKSRLLCACRDLALRHVPARTEMKAFAGLLRGRI
jgi:2-polyprenyl-6-methoxyphenol hydroxylase-like FAD-dependent oxidoreductase